MLWYLLIFGSLFIIAKIVINIMNKSSVNKAQKRGKQLLEEGKWKEAAAVYKEGILEVLDSEQSLLTLVLELKAIYQNNGVQANLSKIGECPKLLNDIDKQKGSPKERGKLIGKVHREAREFLDSLP